MADGKVVVETGLDNSGIEQGLKKLGGLVKAGVAAAGIGKLTSELVNAGKAAVEVGSNFEAGMSNVSAISGVTGEELDQLTSKAKEMGAKTKFSATEASQAFQYMAMAGWKTTDMLNGIDGVMNLAAASGEDLASVSDIVTDAITAFGLSAKDSGHFADVLGAASSNANTNVGMLGESFKYVAPIAGAMKYSVEDVSTALGLMANASVKGSMAGTSLKTALANMAAPTDKMAEVMDKYGISLTNTDGSMKSLGEVIKMLREKLGGLDETTQTAAASTLFGKEAMAGMLAIVNAAPADYEKLTKAIYNADGTAQKMADTMNDNLKGKVTILGSALEGFGIQVYESMETPLKDAADSATVSVDKVSKAFVSGGMKGAVKEAGEIFRDFVIDVEDSNKAVGNLIRPVRKTAEEFLYLGKKALPVAAKATGLLCKNLDKLVTVAGAGAAAFESYKIINKVSKWYTTASAASKAYAVAMTVEGTVANANSTAHLLLASTMSKTELVIGVLTGKVSLATAGTLAMTAAQGALNTVMAMNPFALLAAGIAAVAGGYALYNHFVGDAADATTGLTEKQEENIKKHKEAIEAIEQETEARRKNVAASTTEINQADSLFGQLDTLVDKNGRVKKGYEDRANFIVNQLNSALGTEITIVDGVIQKYDELKDSIDDVIVKKKAEAMLSAMESDYTEALQEQADKAADLGKAFEKLNATKKKATELETELAAEAEKTKTYYHNNGEEVKVTTDRYKELQTELDKLKGKTKEQQAAFDEASAAMQDNQSAIADYEMLLEASMSGSVDSINAAVATLQSGIDTTLEAGSDAAQKQANKASETFLAIMEAQKSGVADLKDKTVYGAAEAMAMAVSTISDSSESIKELLERAGDEGAARMIAGMVRADFAGNLSAEGKNGVQAMLQTISGMDEESKKAMSDVVSPMLTELESAASKLDGAARDDAEILLTALKEALGIHSPSAEVEAIFSQVWPGAEQGLEEGQDGPLATAGNFVQEFLGKFESADFGGKMKSAGVKVLQLFGVGASSQVSGSKKAGMENAKAANAGAASVNPKATGTTFGTLLNSGITGTKSMLSKAGGMIATAARSAAGSINPSAQGKNFGSSYASAISGTKSGAETAAKAVANAANSTRGIASASAKSAGYNFGAGFSGGIRSAISSAVSAAASLASSALSAIKSKLKIHSPSKATGEVADYTVEGFVINMKKNLPDVEKVSDDMAETILRGVDVSKQIGRMRAAMGSEKLAIGNSLVAKVVHEVTVGSQEDICRLGDKIEELKNYIGSIEIRMALEGSAYINGREAGQLMSPEVSRQLGEFAELKGRGNNSR